MSLTREFVATSSPTYGPDYVRSLKPYVAGIPTSAIAREYGFDETEVIKLASNENSFGMPASARCAIEALATCGSAAYPDPDAYELKTAIEHALNVPRSWVTAGNGSSDLIDMITRAFVKKGQSVVVSQYSFSSYLLAVQAIDARSIVVPATDFGHDLDAMLDAIEPDTKLMFVANPNNPTGTFHPPHEIRRFLDHVPEDVVVVLDEAYTEYLLDDQQSNIADLVAQYRNLIVLRTFSKAYALASLRIGFAIAQEPLSDLLNRVRLPFNTNAFAQAAATAAIADQDFVVRSRAENSVGREQLYAGFNAMRLPYLVSAGNFILVHVGDGAQVFNALLRDGIIVRPVSNYALPEWLRVSVGLQEQNKRFLKSLTRIMVEDLPSQR